MKTVITGILIFVLCGAAYSFGAGQNAAELEQGRRLFEGLCSRCHGFEGTGGEGPNLNRPLTRAGDDESLRTIMRDGIPSRGRGCGG